MPLVKAVVAGAIAAIAIPFLARGESASSADGSAAAWSISRPAATILDWSWPIFCVVTLLTWGLLAGRTDERAGAIARLPLSLYGRGRGPLAQRVGG